MLELQNNSDNNLTRSQENGVGRGWETNNKIVALPTFF